MTFSFFEKKEIESWAFLQVAMHVRNLEISHSSALMWVVSFKNQLRLTLTLPPPPPPGVRRVVMSQLVSVTAPAG
jgi:hypothetical protein